MREAASIAANFRSSGGCLGEVRRGFPVRLLRMRRCLFRKDGGSQHESVCGKLRQTRRKREQEHGKQQGGQDACETGEPPAVFAPMRLSKSRLVQGWRCRTLRALIPECVIPFRLSQPLKRRKAPAGEVRIVGGKREVRWLRHRSGHRRSRHQGQHDGVVNKSLPVADGRRRCLIAAEAGERAEIEAGHFALGDAPIVGRSQLLSFLNHLASCWSRKKKPPARGAQTAL
jgi:hypothetical protein